MKEMLYEVVRDCSDNLTVCDKDNFDPFGVHTMT